ncbi:MAG: DUF4625 domain-containing protein [Paludibacteraceae bacterium]
MKNLKFSIILFLSIATIISCENNNIDKEKPVIDLTIENAFPQNCDTLYFGKSFILKMHFSDNFELGSYSIDIHNNFTHHSHSTEIEECVRSIDKSSVNPYTAIDEFKIPAGKTEYITHLPISIPLANASGNFDDGDYHFFVSLTDKSGWSAQKGLSVKILHSVK